MVAVLAVIAVLWISGISSLLGSHAQAERGLAQVRRLAAQHRALAAEQKSLHQRRTILDQARALGMVKSGEQAFIVVNH
jgi:cell division protein FtsB